MFKSKKAVSAPSDIGRDTSGCTPMQGLLAKINSSGVWKDRYGQLNNSYLMVYKPKAGKPTPEIKEAIDLRLVESASLDAEKHIKFVMNNGDVLIYKGDSMELWMFAIETRLEWINENRPAKPPAPASPRPVVKTEESTKSEAVSPPAPPAPNSPIAVNRKESFKSEPDDNSNDGERLRNRTVSSDATTSHMEGLMKKINSSGVWKDRYGKLDGSVFTTYKPKNGKPTSEVKETIDLRQVDSIDFDASWNMKIVLNGEEMVFKADNTQAWVSVLQGRLERLAQESVRVSGDGNIEGPMKKLNSSGVWKDRYGKLVGNVFTTFKPKGGRPTSEVKERVDMQQMDCVEVDGEGHLVVTLNSGEEWTFRVGNAQMWEELLQARLDVFAEDTESADVAAIVDINRVHIAGTLKKKSHNKLQTKFQKRYVKLEGKMLSYYKSKGDDKEAGSANLETVEFIRAFDDSSDCRVFEVKDNEERVFVFQTKTHKEMNTWLAVLNKVKDVLQKMKQEAEAARLAALKPYRIRWYDELNDEEEFAVHIIGELSELYPPEKPPKEATEEEEQGENAEEGSVSSAGASDTEEGGEEQEEQEEEQEQPPAVEQEEEDGTPVTIRQHLRCASQVVGYLKSLIPEVQKTSTHPARYDVLAAVMVTVNRLLSYRMLAFLNPNRQQGIESSGSEGKPKRHPLLENANLGELHSVIDWIVKHQTTLKSILCPHSAKDPHQSPKYCQLFDELPAVCHLYAYGGSKGAKGGAAAHLYDHINKVWMSVIRQPEEMLQKHSNGTFYTNAPIGMWEAINQHIALAKSTNCPILHVMLADRVVTSLNHVVNNIIDYVEALDTCPRRELKEIELEFISALANDTALHIEEVIDLIENFSVVEIRQRIDEIFDPMTTNLVNCGQACLKRLARLVMSDVQSQLDEVFMPEWLEGNQVSVAIATISDYMSDFEEFLVHFWADKFVYTILEEVILSYCRSIVFRKPSAPGAAPAPVVVAPVAPEPVKKGFFSFFAQKAKETVSNVAASVVNSAPTHVPIDEESLGRLAQDVNTLNAFFSKKAGQEMATEFLQIINEISLMLFLDVQSIAIHVMRVIEEYPSSALAVFETAYALMRLRPEEIPKSHLEGIYIAQVRPCMQNAAEHALANEQNGIAEGRLGLLYQDLVPKEVLKAAAKANNVSTNEGKTTLAQRLKNMSNIPSLVAKYKTEEEEEVDEEEDSKRVEINTDGLLDDMMEVLNQQEEAEAAAIREIEEETLKEEQLRQEVGKLSYDGYLEKKSPAHNQWQRRFYKITTRETNDANKPYVYSFIWYKKEGDSAIKALDCSQIASLTMTQCPRPLAYSPLKMSLYLSSEVKDQLGVVTVVPTERDDATSSSLVHLVNTEYTTFTVVQTDGKEHILRGTKVDRIIKWINTLSLAASLGYDEQKRCWNKAGHAEMKLRQMEVFEQSNRSKAAAAAKPAPPPPPPAAPQVAVTTDSPILRARAASVAKEEERLRQLELQRQQQQEEEEEEQERRKLEEEQHQQELLRQQQQQQQQGSQLQAQSSFDEDDENSDEEPPRDDELSDVDENEAVSDAEDSEEEQQHQPQNKEKEPEPEPVPAPKVSHVPVAAPPVQQQQQPPPQPYVPKQRFDEFDDDEEENARMQAELERLKATKLAREQQREADRLAAEKLREEEAQLAREQEERQRERERELEEQRVAKEKRLQQKAQQLREEEEARERKEREEREAQAAAAEAKRLARVQKLKEEEEERERLEAIAAAEAQEQQAQADAKKAQLKREREELKARLAAEREEETRRAAEEEERRARELKAQQEALAAKREKEKREAEEHKQRMLEARLKEEEEEKEMQAQQEILRKQRAEEAERQRVLRLQQEAAEAEEEARLVEANRLRRKQEKEEAAARLLAEQEAARLKEEQEELERLRAQAAEREAARAKREKEQREMDEQRARLQAQRLEEEKKAAMEAREAERVRAAELREREAARAKKEQEEREQQEREREAEEAQKRISRKKDADRAELEEMQRISRGIQEQREAEAIAARKAKLKQEREEAAAAAAAAAAAGGTKATEEKPARPESVVRKPSVTEEMMSNLTISTADGTNIITNPTKVGGTRRKPPPPPPGSAPGSTGAAGTDSSASPSRQSFTGSLPDDTSSDAGGSRKSLPNQANLMRKLSERSNAL